MMGWQWHQLNHMQAICTSLQQKTTPAPHQSDSYGPGALPDTESTASKHWSSVNNIINISLFHCSSFTMMNLGSCVSKLSIKRSETSHWQNAVEIIPVLPRPPLLPWYAGKQFIPRLEKRWDSYVPRVEPSQAMHDTVGWFAWQWPSHAVWQRAEQMETTHKNDKSAMKMTDSSDQLVGSDWLPVVMCDVSVELDVTTTTTTISRPFVRDYPGESVPEG